MPRPVKGPRLGSSPTHERLILRSLTAQPFEHGRITTTRTKARRVQSLAEKFITRARQGDLHSHRLVLESVTDRGVVAKLFEEITSTLQDRNGGCTHITEIGVHKGDSAPLAVLGLVTEPVEHKSEG